MKIHCIQHVPFEGPGCIAVWARKHNAEISFTRVFEPHRMPDPASFDLLLLMGGPMSVTEEDLYPWLADEKKLVRQSMAAGKKILGICLGAQMIASALGQEIYKNPEKEIGWYPVTFTPEARKSGLFEGFPEQAVVFHWHGETFGLPEQAIHLGSSLACRHQGFLINEQVVGLQFHLEETIDSLQDISESCRAELVPGPFVQDEKYFRSQNQLAEEANQLLYSLLDRFKAS
ncbi:MAG: type 1 glutamine amidotransferase [Bacteroidales bacterium]